MLRVSYTAHETNISVLQRMGQERQLPRTIKERQTSFTGHIIRKGELEDLILAGKVQGKKARGGQRLLFLNQVMENTELTSPRTTWDAARNLTLKLKTSWVVKGRIDQGTEERERESLGSRNVGAMPIVWQNFQTLAKCCTNWNIHNDYEHCDNSNENPMLDQ